MARLPTDDEKEYTRGSIGESMSRKEKGRATGFDAVQKIQDDGSALDGC